MPISKIKKIIIFGRPGSGKSTFGKNLHNILGIQIFYLDKYFFVNNWQERNYQEFLELHQKLIDKESWIIDGNCLDSLEKRISQADLILYFNYPRYICYFRILKRFFRKDYTIDDRAPLCKENINYKLIRYIWRFHKRVDQKFLDFKKKYSDKIFIEIANDQGLFNLLNILK